MSVALLAASLAAAPAAIKGYSNQITNLATDSCDIFGMVGALLDSAAAAVMKLAEHAIQEIVKAIAELAAPFIALIKEIGDLLTLIGDIVDELILPLITDLVATVLGVVDLIGETVAAAGELITNVAKNLGKIVKAIGAAACTGVLGIAQALGDSAINSALGDAKAVVSGGIASTAAGAAAVLAGNQTATAAAAAATNLTGGVAAANTAIASKVSALKSAAGLA